LRTVDLPVGSTLYVIRQDLTCVGRPFILASNVPLLIACDDCREAKKCCLYILPCHDVHDPGCGCPRAGQSLTRFEMVLCESCPFPFPMPYHHGKPGTWMGLKRG
jgi:hypothetical protein